MPVKTKMDDIKEAIYALNRTDFNEMECYDRPSDIFTEEEVAAIHKVREILWSKTDWEQF